MNHSNLLPRYQHLRLIARAMNDRMVQSLPRDVLHEGGQKLGILKDGVFLLESEDMSSVLMDYCLHDVRRQGVNTIERFLAANPPPPDSDEMKVLQSMRQANFTLLHLQSAEPGVGVHVHDLFRDEPLFIMDVSFSRSTHPDLLLASRVMPADGFWQTTGAALPIGKLAVTDRAEFLKELAASVKCKDFRNLSLEKASEVSAAIIRLCLEGGAAEHIKYAEPKAARWDDGSSGKRGQGMARTAAPVSAQRVGRNDPCPCGSGKKYKRCCGVPR